MIRVLIADDEPLIRTGIRTVLESDPQLRVVAEVDDGSAVLDAVARHRVDVALLDIRMSTLDGLGALAELSRKAPTVRAVMLTSFGVEANVLRAVQHGAAGFVLKHCAPDELIRAVRSAYEGNAYLSPEVTRMVLRLVTPADARRQQEAAARLERLTTREAEILALVAQGRSNADIAGRVGTTEATVKTYVSRILTKLDCTNRVQAALLARDALRPS